MSVGDEGVAVTGSGEGVAVTGSGEGQGASSSILEERE
jgi:hypothetical protein